MQMLTGPHPPLTQLLALLPVVLFYEVAISIIGISDKNKSGLDVWFGELLSRIGLSAWYLPGILVLAVLLVVHLYRRDPWQIRADSLWKLWGEALLWTVPMVVLYLLFSMPIGEHLAAALSLFDIGGGGGSLRQVVTGVGAALFEEFVFRLVLISVALLLMQKLFHAPSAAAQIVAVCVSAALFATAHPPSSDNDARAQLEFLYRVSAGIYLGAIYLKRGFATATIVHATFNTIAVFLS